MASNVSTGVSLAGDAAAIASNPYNPISWAKAIGDLWGAFGGGGAGYAQSTGYEIKGSVTNGIFSGAVTGLSSNGKDNYRISEAEGAYGERANLNASVATWWSKYFPDNPSGTIPIDVTLPYDWGGQVLPYLENVFRTVSGAYNKARADAATVAAAQQVVDAAASTDPSNAMTTNADTAAILGATDPTGTSMASTGVAPGQVPATPLAVVTSNPFAAAAVIAALLYFVVG